MEVVAHQRFDLLVAARLLAAKLVGGEGQDFQAVLVVLVIHSLEAWVGGKDGAEGRQVVQASEAVVKGTRSGVSRSL